MKSSTERGLDLIARNKAKGLIKRSYWATKEEHVYLKECLKKYRSES